MIKVVNLTKQYGNFKAVDAISFEAKDGEITVLLGPNGAGKSTTIKSIANLLKFQGEILINEKPNASIEAKRGFGYIPETPILYDTLTIDEHVRFIARAYRLPDAEQLADQYLQVFHLENKRSVITRELSKGMRQKVSMLLALILRPKTLLVDEPMMGLDPASIEETLQLFEELKQQGIAVLISTHIIDIMDHLWDAAYIMDKGRIVKSVRKEELGAMSLKELFFACTSRGEE